MTDPDTGLVHFGWRDYDPTIGRFTALDPAKDRRGDGDLYDYCIDDPVSRVDPTGLWSKTNFDESKVSRDNLGQFASAPGGGGGSSGAAGASVNGNAANSANNATAAQSDSAILVADAGTTATDAGGQTAQRVDAKVREAEIRPGSAAGGTLPPERTYYVIGKRPLDSYFDRTAQAVTGLGIEHRQFIADDGSNRGLFPEGFQEDSTDNMKKYTYYDTHKYKAEFIDEAIRQYESERGPAAANAVMERIPSSPDEGNLELESTYNFGAHNCLIYVRDVIKLAEKLAKQKGESLYYE